MQGLREMLSDYNDVTCEILSSGISAHESISNIQGCGGSDM